MKTGNRYSFISILLIFLLSFTGRAATFKVTTNADSGPGSLREALQQALANGISTPDLILFNINGITLAERTITIADRLPSAGAVIIDGTTQPGQKFGLSDAKICIKPASVDYITCINIIGNAEIYGLMIIGFEYSATRLSGDGITISEQCKAIIGAPGKGNVLTGHVNGIFGNLGDCKIQCNMIGLNADGINVLGNNFGLNGVTSTTYLDNTMIGGNSIALGNYFSGNRIAINFEGTTPTDETVNIVNNTFGVDKSNNLVPRAINDRTYSLRALQKININFKDNVIGPIEDHACIDIKKGVALKVIGNFFGTDRVQSKKYGRNYTWAIQAMDDSKVTVGGETPEEQNVFTNFNTVFTWESTGAINVIKNTFYCNKAIILNDYPGVKTTLKILEFRKNRLSGKALPGSFIQLYYSEAECNGICNPKARFATTIADNSGNWVYDGPVAGPIMASGTLNGRTTGFAPIGLTPGDVKVVDFKCGQKGSISLIDNFSGDWTFKWKDNRGNLLSTTQSVSGLDPGTYTFEYSMDGGCTYITETYNLLRVENLGTVTYPLTVRAECADIAVTGSYEARDAGENTFVWENESGDVIGYQQKIKLTPGKYYFSAISSSGCISNKSLVIVLPSLAQYTLNESAKVVIDARCSENGSITGLVGTSTTGSAVTYKWVDTLGMTVGTQQDLLNAAPGVYRLMVYGKDERCAAISSPIEIGDIDGVRVNTGKIKYTAGRCGLPNGSITGINASNVLRYRWFDANNNAVSNQLDLTDVIAGEYTLVLSNSMCSRTLGPYTIPAASAAIVILTPPTVKNDVCHTAIGSISGIVQSSAEASTSFSWTNSAGIEVAETLDLTNAVAGDYRLTIKNSTCEQDFYYNIPNVDASIPAPVMTDKFVCSRSEIVILFKENAAGYRLYGPNGAVLATGDKNALKVRIKDSGKYAASLINGTCESAKTPFSITVGSSSVKIPTAFSPNRDNINDKWQIKGLELYSAPSVNVYNRFGALVYHSIGYENPFEGKSYGQDLPAGVYYYMIRLTSECPEITGSVLLIK